MKIKGFSWVGVGVEALEPAVAFFTEVLGLEVLAGDGKSVAILSVADGQLLEIFGPGSRGQKLTSPPAIAFEVEDVAAAKQELLSHDVELIGDIGSWNGFEWLYFRGPEGRIFLVKKTPPAGWEKHT